MLSSARFCGRSYTSHSHSTDLGAFIQDTWTRDRLTLNYGTRFNYYRSYAIPGDLGPVPLAPTRNVHFDQSPIEREEKGNLPGAPKTRVARVATCDQALIGVDTV